MHGDFQALAVVCSTNLLRNSNRVTNVLDPNQVQTIASPDIGQNCLQRFAASNTSCHTQLHGCIFLTSVLHEHKRSSHYAVTHAPNKNSDIQGKSPSLVKVIFHTKRNCS